MTDEPLTKGLLELDDALRLIGQVVTPVRDTIEIALDAALGYVTAAAITAPYALPPFDNTGVDGFAFRHGDVVNSTLKLSGQSLAGEPLTTALPAGYAAHIATGAVLPAGADTVVMQEHVQITGDTITLNPVPPMGSNIRRSGFDIQTGDVAIPAQHRLVAADIALLAALGFTSVRVIRPLRIGILATGTELREAGAQLGAGQIIDTNSLMLKQMLAGMPVTITMLGALPDDRAATDAALTTAATTHDLIISTGGVSVGRRDYIRDAMQALGKVHFWKLALRPGKPVMFGNIGNCLMLGLPGNPVSVMVTFYLVARGVMQALWGTTPALPAAFMVPVTKTVTKEKHLRSFPRAKLVVVDGVLSATPYRDQSSNLITSLVGSDGLLDLPVGETEVKARALVRFRGWRGFYC